MTTRRNVFLAVGVLSALVGGALGWRDAVAMTSAAATPAPTAAPEVAEAPATPVELQLHLAGAVDGCSVLLPPDARGTARFSAHVVADPVLGSVVNAVEILDDTIDDAAFSECVVAATLGTELGEATAGEIKFRYSAGAPADNAKEFLVSHPTLVDQYPQLATIRDREIDAPRSEEDATAFATILMNDASAMAAFEQWSADQGLDLSGVSSSP